MSTTSARVHWNATLASAALAACLFGLPAAAETPEAFYAGKQLNFYVGAGAGGGYDFMARTLSRYWHKYIPGKPNIVVITMPGAGGSKMVNWAYNVAPRDGSVLGMPLLTAPMNQLTRPQAVRYDANKLNWIGNMERTTGSIFTWHTSPTKTIEIARKRRTPMGASGKSSILYQMMTLSNKLLGTKFDIVLGYNGTERVQAVERGEVEGSFSNLENFAGLAPHWVSDGLTSKLNILVVNTKQRVPQLPNVPTMIELAKTDLHKQMLSFMMLQSSTGRAVFTTQGAPADRVSALRRSFDRAMKDEGFRADLKRAHIELNPNTGEEVQAAVAELIGTRPAIVEEIRKAFK